MENICTNCCHLDRLSLTAENANEKTLTTGTAILNVDGMLPLRKNLLWRIFGVKETEKLRALPGESVSLEGNNLGWVRCADGGGTRGDREMAGVPRVCV